MKRPLLLLAALALSLSAAAPRAVADGDYVPITAQFTGKGALVLPYANSLDINNGGTIEFWVAANWQGTLDYDPAILACSGPRGPRFAVHMTGDARGLGVFAGQNYDGVGYDFRDGALHYVALVNAADSIAVYIDGELRKVLGFGYADLPATEFSIGSIGSLSPFVGEIGQVRIWDEPLDPGVLNRFSLQPIEVTGPNAHPDVDGLVGASAFGNPETGGFVVVGEDDEPNLTDAEPPAIDDSGLRPLPQ